MVHRVRVKVLSASNRPPVSKSTSCANDVVCFGRVLALPQHGAQTLSHGLCQCSIEDTEPDRVFGQEFVRSCVVSMDDVAVGQYTRCCCWTKVVHQPGMAACSEGPCVFTKHDD